MKFATALLPTLKLFLSSWFR